MTVNHGLYTDTLWAVAVTFTNAAGTALDLSSADYILDVIGGGATVFSFKSTGGGATDGVIDLTDATTGQLNFTATEAQHASFNAGNYRVHLYTTATDSIWQATGKMLVGAPGAKSTYLTFDAVDNGAANVANPIEITQGGGGGGGTWGSITGTLANQTDLNTALGLKLDASLISAYGLTLAGAANAAAARTVLGLGSLALLSSLAISDVTGLQTALDGKQAAGSYAASVHSHAIADVTGLQTALDAKLAASAVSVFGLTLVDDADAATARTTLGLGTAALSATGDFAAASHNHAASAITSGTIETARLGSGTANSGTYLRGDQTWAAISAAGDVVGPASSTDNALARFDSTTGKLLQDSSGATLSDNWALTLAGATVTASEPLLDLTQTWNAGGVTFTGIRFNVTNTASASGSLLLDLQVNSASAVAIARQSYDISTPSIHKPSGAMNVGTTNQALFFGASSAGNSHAYLTNNDFRLRSSTSLGWSSSSSNALPAHDTSLFRIAAAIIGVRGSSSSSGGSLSFIEQTAPSSPATNGVYIYAQDNGASKTQLMALFATGAAQQIAIEP